MNAEREIRTKLARLYRDVARVEEAWLPRSQQQWALNDLFNDIEHLEGELDFVISREEERNAQA